MDKKRDPKKSSDGYAPTKDKIKDDDKNYDDNNEAMDDADPDSKASCRMAWDRMWDNGGPGVWAPNYREQYDLKNAEWSFNAVPKIMDRMNVSVYVDLEIELKLGKLEEEEAQQLADIEAVDMGGGGLR